MATHFHPRRSLAPHARALLPFLCHRFCVFVISVAVVAAAALFLLLRLLLFVGQKEKFRTQLNSTVIRTIHAVLRIHFLGMALLSRITHNFIEMLRRFSSFEHLPRISCARPPPPPCELLKMHYFLPVSCFHIFMIIFISLKSWPVLPQLRSHIHTYTHSPSTRRLD